MVDKISVNLLSQHCPGSQQGHPSPGVTRQYQQLGQGEDCPTLLWGTFGCHNIRGLKLSESKKSYNGEGPGGATQGAAAGTWSVQPEETEVRPH